MSKLIIVTGPQRGFGRAVTDAFSAAGWRVAAMPRFRFNLLNLDMNEVTVFLDGLAREGHSTAVFVSNAAVHHIGSAANLTPDDIRQSVAVNLSSPALLISEFLRRFPKGLAVNVTSSAAKTGISHWPLYAATKAAMEGFTRCLAAEKFNAIDFDPGMMDTDMQKQIRAADFPQAKAFAVYQRIGKLAKPEDVAAKLLAEIESKTTAS